MAVLFPTDLERQQPSDEQVVLAAGSDNIAHNMRVGDLVNYVRENVPLETLIETNSSQQSTIETMAQTAEGKDATIAQLTANQTAPALEAELSAGKTDLAEAITAKGVQTAATDSLATMADNVREIQTKKITIDGGEMYAKQLYGSLTPPKFWNLYDVLAQLLSDGRLSQYGGILLAEYYRGYDSLALSGAGSGGAYVVSDKGSDGQFVMYTEDTTHTWDVAFDGYGNRWVAYCFAGEYHDFRITDTSTSPRSIFIGRKVGTITSLVNGRVNQVVVSDGNELIAFSSNNHTQNFGKFLSLRVKTVIGGQFLNGGAFGTTSQTECGYVECDNVNADIVVTTGGSWIINARDIITGLSNNGLFRGGAVNIAILRAPVIEGVVMRECTMFNGVFIAEEIRKYNNATTFFSQVSSLYLGYITNNKTKSVNISSVVAQTTRKLYIQYGWCKPLNIATFSSLLEEDIVSNILQRLKQDEPDCGDGVTITLGSTNLAKLTSEESQALLAELRGTYGYTFA